jgi:RNA polymerase sigma factor (sigma-70 family)
MSDTKSFPSDSELLRAIRTGDESTRQAAKQTLVEKHTPRLKASSHSQLRRKNCNQPAVHVNGVVNATWINVFANLDDLDDDEKFVQWSGTIGRNVTTLHLRGCIAGQISSVQMTDDSLYPPAEISGYYSSKDAAIDADRMLTFAHSVSEDSGSIFYLHHVEEVGFGEIARRLGKNEDAVRTQYYRLIRKMKRKFGNDH